MNFLSYFTPQKLFQIAGRYVWAARASAFASFCGGLYVAFFASPPDYQQGEAVRIMYVHVPASWLALAIYGFMTVVSIIALVGRMPTSYLIVKAAAPLGAAFTLISLLTGMLWGRPMWGAWWVWDARLTSVLILFFLYSGYLLLIESIPHKEQGHQFGAFLIIMGSINLPIIKWSVDWWNTLHQPASLMRFGAPALPGSMMAPLFLMFAGFLACFIWGLLRRIQNEILLRKIQALNLEQTIMQHPPFASFKPPV